MSSSPSYYLAVAVVVIGCLWFGPVVVVAVAVDVSSQQQQQQKSSSLLILGLGRVGLACAKQALPHFDQVVGTVRSTSTSVSSSPPDGIHRIPFDSLSIRSCLSQQQPQQHQQNWSVLITIPLPRQPDPELERVWQDVAASQPSWLGLVSTTGVYGNHNGNWVTEDSELRCATASNADLYKRFEQEWITQKQQQQQLRIFRCAGIYDSAQSALHTVYKQGYDYYYEEEEDPQPSSTSNNDNDSTPTPTPPSVTNRIHALDIARAIVTSMTTTTTSPVSTTRIYNLADNRPAPRSEVQHYAADLFRRSGVTLSSPIKSSTSSSTSTVRERRRATDRKLVSNQRMRDELLPALEEETGLQQQQLQYPTYREGLQAILVDPTTPWNQPL